jgi:hypothetical protein
MADRPDVAKGELAGILRAYGLNPKLFDDLIRDAIINQWTPEQFLGEIYASDEFSAAFPGIFNPDGSLKVTAGEYLQLAYGFGGYVDIARNFGLTLGPRKIGMLFESNTSPDEWVFKAMVLQQAKRTEGYRTEFNVLLEASGQEPLGKGEWYNFIASKSSARIENLYEAVSLRMAGDLDITPEQALAAAREIGATNPAAPVDIAQIIDQVRRYKSLISPELESAGITDADLAVLEAGADPRNLRGQLEQILRNREALISAGAGSGGGVRGGLFPAAREGL